MRKVNSASKRVIDKLAEGLSRVGDHAKIDNAKGAFLPVSVEIVDRTPPPTATSTSAWPTTAS